MKLLYQNQAVIPRSAIFRGKRAKAGLNLIELVVVVAVLGVTLMLVLPMLQGTRETSRRMQCRNHLKELALACCEHLAAMHHFPTGGWPGPDYWMGDPDLGFGSRQPGGWTYNILPFMENKAMHDWGSCKTVLEKMAVFSDRTQTPLGLFYCPSRRPPLVYPISSGARWNPCNMNMVLSGARTDYAANGRLDNGRGIIYTESLTTITDISDGLSHTYLLGEKNLIADHYTDGSSLGDGLPAYGNSFWDWERSGHTPPVQDRQGRDNYTAFGSAHPMGFNMSFCDGSVFTVNYDIDPALHLRSCDRRGGKIEVVP
jgi:prepilin-type N-terminal cleavage/methylation domain-containing protein